MSQVTQQIDWQAIRTELRAAPGESIWRSLDELNRSPVWSEDLSREFAEGESEWDSGVSRRNFLQLLGASLALAGATTGCSRRVEEQIVPYVNPPEQIVAGKPLHFATALTHDGYARGVLVESHEGRPTKIEGNPDHPASLGAADIFMQASILDLYDPDRSQVITRGQDISSWGAFASELRSRLSARSDGDGIALLTGPYASPTFLDQLAEFSARFPKAQWCCHDPVGNSDRAELPLYAFDKADVVLSLDSDFLFAEPMSLRYSRQFIDRRRVRRDRTEMNRLYVVESTPTLTGSMADHRLPVRPSEMAAVADEILRRLDGNTGAASLPHTIAQWVAAVADDLLQARKNGKPTLVVAGAWQSPAVHDAIDEMNRKLGNIGSTVTSFEIPRPAIARSLRELTADIRGGGIDTLLILDANPAYSAPADISFASALAEFSSAEQGGVKRNFSAHLGSHSDETAFRCQWHIPLSHALEAWGDAQTPDGVASIVQPLIAPLYDSKSIIEVMEALLDRPDRSGYQAVRQHWAGTGASKSAAGFESWWVAALKRGVIEQSALVPAAAPPTGPAASTQASAQAIAAVKNENDSSLELLIRPDPTIYDGSQSNNGWLQELPKPFTKLVWDNAALIPPKLAEERGLADGDVVVLRYGGRELEAPVMILPGQADRTVTIHLGYGHGRGGRVATDQDTKRKRGFNAYLLRTSDAPWGGPGLTLEKTGRTYHLVTTRSHHGMDPVTARGVLRPEPVATPDDSKSELDLENRRLVRVATIEEFRKNPKVIQDLGSEDENRRIPLTLYTPADSEWDYTGKLKWGMSIDLNSCIGCNACVIACQAENNIAVVGKEQVGKQREMHWIRVDDYYAGDLDNPKVYHQPVPCMQCENAPCELVCPVGATTHSAEGINEMTYNRCIGTRYCSNNCPYKVRRFNFLNYQDISPSLMLQRNPEVTVRSRGVMEKCNYCLQRITRTRLEREKALVEIEDRARRAVTEDDRRELLQLRDAQQIDILNALQTACQQSCPTQAIVFGDLNDRSSHGGNGSLVRQLKSEPLDYGLLTELTTKPRTTYMARLRNPNPALEPEGSRP
jgi:molybdopterin-containing oxidoreductase family iron-sulfur binding subunit